MAEESQQERTERATDKRRDEFREKGQVAQSREVNTAALMTMTLLTWIFYAPFFWHGLKQLMIWSLQLESHFDATPPEVMQLFWTLAARMALLLAPIFLMTLIVGFLACYLQVGPLFTTRPFTEISLEKFNPITGLGRLFSKRSLVELLKSCAKVGLIAYVAWRTVRGEVGGALDLVQMAPGQLLTYLGQTTMLVMGKTCGILVLLAVIDYAYTHWEMEERMKMTKQEVKEEHKETEGDPHVKGRIRSIQTQMARRRMMAEVPKADVVVTNPTHFAVALSYVRGEMDAPKVVAKGADHLAARIRELARDNGVPIVENKPVARALYKAELGAAIPEDMFKAVAEILAYVYSLKRH